MKRSRVLLLLILFAFGCSKKDQEPIIVKWENKHRSKGVERILASDQEGQCFRDVFRPQTLKKEIREIEARYADAPRVSGSWKHLDLSRLPVSQANFLKTFGKEIGDLSNPDSHDFSSCEDVPCLLNKIYQKEDYVGGYVHYLWYLKFGVMLALDNKIPEQASGTAGLYNGKSIPFENFLLSEKELYAFWRISHMLRPPFSDLKYLKEIQRIPRGEKFEGLGRERACGLASSAGWIILTDNCLSLSHLTDLGYLYQSVVHELGHQVDYEQGRGSRAFYRSHRQDYLDLAGMYLEEYVGEDGKPRRRWAHRPDIRLISSYAGSAPHENFAESLSIFRIDGDTAKEKITDKHFKFVSTEYYQERSFQKEELIKFWLFENSGDLEKQIFNTILDCHQGPRSEIDNYFMTSDFREAPPQNILNCISFRAREIGKFFKSKTMLREPEGCVIQENVSSRSKWEPLVKQHLKLEFQKYLSTIQRDPEFIHRIRKFISGMSDKTLSRKSFISCFMEKDESICYQEELKKGVVELTGEFHLSASQADDLVRMYTSFHPYDSIRTETLELYRTFVSSFEDSLRKKSIELWESCRSINHDDLGPPTGTLFNVPSGYMVSSFYNCLNSGMEESLKEIIRDFSVEGTTIKHPKEELLVMQELQPKMSFFLKGKLLLERSIEAKKAQEYITKDKGDLRKILLSNLEWVKSPSDQSRLIENCKKEGLRLITFFPLYHLKSSLFHDYLENSVCHNIPSL